MTAFLEDVSGFYGTGERNAKGQTLDEFLAEYDPNKYQNPCSTVDAAIFSYETEVVADINELKVLMIKRKNHPSIGWWALPGGFVEIRENLEESARRELEEETGVHGLRMEQIAAYGDVDRDPRCRVITTAYLSLVKESEVKVQAGDDAADALWCKLKLSKVSEEKQADQGKALYQLRIYQEEAGIDLRAEVAETYYEGLISERKFTVRERGQIASDHAAIIVHALLLLQARLAGK